MLLAIDIGNTTIHLGVFDGEKLKATWNISTGVHRMPDEYASMLLNLMSHRNLSTSQIEDVVICSVVPPLTAILETMCQQYFNFPPLVVEAGTKTGVRILMDNPREVGADRIVNAAAAHHLYGGPLIVIDFGTAATFDAVSKEGDYVGGAIAPGIGIASEALFMRTAKLPRVELTYPKQAIGKNTISALQSGILFGYAGLVETLVRRLRRELGKDSRVIATGSYADLIAKEAPSIEIVSPHLTLIGLRLVYEMNRPSKGHAER